MHRRTHTRHRDHEGDGPVLSKDSGRLQAQASEWPRPPLRHPDVAILTDANFRQEVLESALPVIVDFWSETCVPCRLQEPTIARLAEELRGQAKVGRVSVFDNHQVLADFQIKGVPHLMVVDKGEVILDLVGDHSIEQLRYRLRSIGVIPETQRRAAQA